MGWDGLGWDGRASPRRRRRRRWRCQPEGAVARCWLWARGTLLPLPPPPPVTRRPPPCLHLAAASASGWRGPPAPSPTRRTPLSSSRSSLSRSSAPRLAFSASSSASFSPTAATSPLAPSHRPSGQWSAGVEVGAGGGGRACSGIRGPRSGGQCVPLTAVHAVAATPQRPCPRAPVNRPACLLRGHGCPAPRLRLWFDGNRRHTHACGKCGSKWWSRRMRVAISATLSITRIWVCANWHHTHCNKDS